MLHVCKGKLFSLRKKTARKSAPLLLVTILKRERFEFSPFFDFFFTAYTVEELRGGQLFTLTRSVTEPSGTHVFYPSSFLPQRKKSMAFFHVLLRRCRRRLAASRAVAVAFLFPPPPSTTLPPLPLPRFICPSSTSAMGPATANPRLDS